MADTGAKLKNLKNGALAAILENGGRHKSFWCVLNLHIIERLWSFAY